MVKNLPANVREARDGGSIPGLGRSPGVGNGNLLWYSCQGNPMDRGAWGLESMGSQKVRHNGATEHAHTYLKLKSYYLLLLLEEAVHPEGLSFQIRC